MPFRCAESAIMGYEMALNWKRLGSLPRKNPADSGLPTLSKHRDIRQVTAPYCTYGSCGGVLRRKNSNAKERN